VQVVDVCMMSIHEQYYASITSISSDVCHKTCNVSTMFISVVIIASSSVMMFTAHRFTRRHRATAAGVLLSIMTLICITLFKLQSAFAANICSCVCGPCACWVMMMAS